MITKDTTHCPVDWKSIPSDFNWVSIDYDGGVYAYRTRPKFGGSYWSYIGNCYFISYIKPPSDPEVCIWKRPKTRLQ